MQNDGKVYYFSHHKRDFRSYDDVQSACAEEHGGALLVSINSQAENRFLATNGDGKQFWIGLVCKTGPCSVDGLHWPDGQSVSYNPGLEEIATGDGAILHSSNGGWLTKDLETRKFYVCERDDTCSPNPCLNGGTCLLNTATGNWMCECPDNTGGDNCACDDSQCQNSRPCVDGDDYFTCDCGEHYAGEFCGDDVNECDVTPNICNFGLCENTVGYYRCSCTVGYQGDTCTDDVDECADHNCSSNGLCSNFLGGYNCSCFAGYDVTTDCAEPLGSDKNNKDVDEEEEKQLMDVLIAGLVLMSVLTVITVLAVINDVKSERALKRKKASKPQRQQNRDLLNISDHRDHQVCFCLFCFSQCIVLVIF